MEEYVPQQVVHSAQPTFITSMDGNVEPQDAQPTAIATNKIKINITKNVHFNKQNAIKSSENSDKNLPINNNSSSSVKNGGNDDVTGATIGTQSSTSGALPLDGTKSNQNNETDANGLDSVTEIEYDLKDSMRNIEFKRQAIVKNGFETSGLCSIM